MVKTMTDEQMREKCAELFPMKLGMRQMGQVILPSPNSVNLVNSDVLGIPAMSNLMPPPMASLNAYRVEGSNRFRSVDEIMEMKPEPVEFMPVNPNPAPVYGNVGSMTSIKVIKPKAKKLKLKTSKEMLERASMNLEDMKAGKLREMERMETEVEERFNELKEAADKKFKERLSVVSKAALMAEQAEKGELDADKRTAMIDAQLGETGPIGNILMALDVKGVALEDDEVSVASVATEVL
jgi:hypothetical protein